MRTAVIGLGNRDRGEDAVGLVVADRLAPLRVRADVYAWERPELDLLEVLPLYDRVIFVDAAMGGSPLGTLHHDIEVAADPAELGTHGFGLAGVLELAEALDRLPADLHFMLVEVGTIVHGATMSPVVEAAIDELVDRLVRSLEGDADVPR